MKILILGSDGMIGHKLAHKFHDNSIDLYLNSRYKSEFIQRFFPKAKVSNYNFLNSNVLDLLNKIKPDFILNCSGITIRRGVNEDLDNTFKINAELPNIIHNWSLNKNSKLIQFSTDCVFSGKKGNYLDNDIPDAIDLYGKSKAKGEIISTKTLTIRSSMIGREIFNKSELLEWFIGKKNNLVKGFSNIIYSGITTVQMSNFIFDIIKENIELDGIYNVSSNAISKFELLKKINRKFDLNITVVKDSSYRSDKTLNSSNFYSKTGFNKPVWEKMLDELFLDSIKFNDLYKNN